MRSGGRVVEGARLESEYTPKAYRGFESLPLRQLPFRDQATAPRLCVGRGLVRKIPAKPTRRPRALGISDSVDAMAWSVCGASRRDLRFGSLSTSFKPTANGRRPSTNLIIWMATIVRLRPMRIFVGDREPNHASQFYIARKMKAMRPITAPTGMSSICAAAAPTFIGPV